MNCGHVSKEENLKLILNIRIQRVESNIKMPEYMWDFSSKQQITKHHKKKKRIFWVLTSDRKKIEMANTPNLQKVTSKLLKLNLISTKRYTVYMIHTVRNLHFLSKNSTLISRKNCRFFGGENLAKMLWFWAF